MTEIAAQEARHKGWLCGVALRLAINPCKGNPYDHESLEHLEWEIGFEEGLAG